MDKIWYRNPSKSEVIGRCGGDEKTNDHAEPQNKYKKMNIKMMGLILHKIAFIACLLQVVVATFKI